MKGEARCSADELWSRLWGERLMAGKGLKTAWDRFGGDGGAGFLIRRGRGDAPSALAHSLPDLPADDEELRQPSNPYLHLERLAFSDENDLDKVLREAYFIPDGIIADGSTGDSGSSCAFQTHRQMEREFGTVWIDEHVAGFVQWADQRDADFYETDLERVMATTFGGRKWQANIFAGVVAGAEDGTNASPRSSSSVAPVREGGEEDHDPIEEEDLVQAGRVSEHQSNDAHASDEREPEVLGNAGDKRRETRKSSSRTTRTAPTGTSDSTDDTDDPFSFPVPAEEGVAASVNFVRRLRMAQQRRGGPRSPTAFFEPGRTGMLAARRGDVVGPPHKTKRRSADSTSSQEQPLKPCSGGSSQGEHSEEGSTAEELLVHQMELHLAAEPELVDELSSPAFIGLLDTKGTEFSKTVGQDPTLHAINKFATLRNLTTAGFSSGWFTPTKTQYQTTLGRRGAEFRKRVREAVPSAPSSRPAVGSSSSSSQSSSSSEQESSSPPRQGGARQESPSSSRSGESESRNPANPALLRQYLENIRRARLYAASSTRFQILSLQNRELSLFAAPTDREKILAALDMETAAHRIPVSAYSSFSRVLTVPDVWMAWSHMFLAHFDLLIETLELRHYADRNFFFNKQFRDLWAVVGGETAPSDIRAKRHPFDNFRFPPDIGLPALGRKPRGRAEVLCYLAQKAVEEKWAMFVELADAVWRWPAVSGETDGSFGDGFSETDESSPPLFEEALRTTETESVLGADLFELGENEANDGQRGLPPPGRPRVDSLIKNFRRLMAAHVEREFGAGAPVKQELLSNIKGKLLRKLETDAYKLRIAEVGVYKAETSLKFLRTCTLPPWVRIQYHLIDRWSDADHEFAKMQEVTHSETHDSGAVFDAVWAGLTRLADDYRRAGGSGKRPLVSPKTDAHNRNTEEPDPSHRRFLLSVPEVLVAKRLQYGNPIGYPVLIPAGSEDGEHNHFVIPKDLTGLFVHRASSAAAASHIEGPLDLVFLDGDHSLPGFLGDLQLYAGKVRHYLSGHDFNLQEFPGVGVALLHLRTPGTELWKRHGWRFGDVVMDSDYCWWTGVGGR